MIFNQTLLWVGIFFSPPLAAVIVVKMMATFYLKVKFFVFRFQVNQKQILTSNSISRSENCAHQLLQTTIETVALVADVHTVPVHALCVGYNCHRHLTLRFNAVSFPGRSANAIPDLMHSKCLFPQYRMNVSKACGPFRNHIYMFHVLRGDILKLQEVIFERKKFMKNILPNKLKCAESL